MAPSTWLFPREKSVGWLDFSPDSSGGSSNPRNQMATSKIFHLKWTVTDCEEDYRPLCCKASNAFRSKVDVKQKSGVFPLMEGILKHT